jgi:hypothetical protein
MTVASAVVMALAASVYAFFDLRHRSAERWTAMEGEARAVAAALRPVLEGSVAARGPDPALLTDLGRATGWQVTVLLRSRAGLPPDDRVTEAQLRRLTPRTIATAWPAACAAGRRAT